MLNARKPSLRVKFADSFVGLENRNGNLAAGTGIPLLIHVDDNQMIFTIDAAESNNMTTTGIVSVKG